MAHLDHKLRGRHSIEDAEFVRALAEKLKLPITLSSVDVRAAAEIAGRSIEEVAREIRYDFLLGVAKETGCNRIAVGHTKTDQAETFLMRLVRGAGVRGLASMRPVGRVPVFSDAETGRAEGDTGGGGTEEQRGRGAEGQRSRGAEELRSRGVEEKGTPSAPLPLSSSAPLPNSQLLGPAPLSLLIRPLLCITREEVEDYCRERGLEFRSDETNRSSEYTRNRVRSEVFPALNSINPRAVQAIARAAEHLASDQDALNLWACSSLDAARVESRAGQHSNNDRQFAFSVPAILGQPAGVRRRMIIEAIRLARAAGSAEERRYSGEIVSAHAEAIEALTEPQASGRHISLPDGLEVWREFDVLLFKQGSPRPAAAKYDVAIDSETPDAVAGGFAFTLHRGLPGHLLNSVIEETRREKDRTGQDWLIVGLDDVALPQHLVIRPRRPGERAHVVGQRRTKKLKNLMISHRIPSSRRADWPVVTTSDGSYIWSPGLPPSQEFAARDGTDRLATMRASAT